MDHPQLMLMLGGIRVPVSAGLSAQSRQPIGGRSVMRCSGGDGILSQHWRRQSGSFGGEGITPPGLEGLDYSQALELRSAQTSSIVGPGPEFVLPSTPRPDLDPWAYALVGGVLRLVECSTVGRACTVAERLGAEHYEVWWLPVYSVFADLSESQTTRFSWSVSWEET